MNCDRDDPACDDRDNCDQRVRCLQGEGRRGSPCPWCPGSPFRYPAGTLTHRGDSVGRAQGHSSSSWTHLELLKTWLGLAAAPPNILIAISGKELTHLSLPVEQRMLTLFEHLLCARPFPKFLSGSIDLEDMSVMVLRTQGPAALFDDHRLVLHTSSYDAKRARVFHACGEFMPTPPSPTPLPRGPVPHLGQVGMPSSGSGAALGTRARRVRCSGTGRLASPAQPWPELVSVDE